MYSITVNLNGNYIELFYVSFNQAFDKMNYYLEKGILHFKTCSQYSFKDYNLILKTKEIEKYLEKAIKDLNQNGYITKLS